MTAVTTRRWTDDGTTWFAISGVGPELAAPAEHVLMDYQRNGDEWRRGCPADTPGLDICWQNFASCAELMLRQAARLQPVPWRGTLHELCRRTSGRESSWWLAGSTALAVRGARIEPGDIDLVCSGDGALGPGVIFADAIIEPVVHDASSPVSDYWGRAFLGARLEWIGAPKAGVDSPSPSDPGPVAASRLETVTWEGWQLRVPPLDLQRAVSQRRGSPAAWHSSTRCAVNRHRLTFHAGDTVLLAAGFLGRVRRGSLSGHFAGLDNRRPWPEG